MPRPGSGTLMARACVARWAWDGVAVIALVWRLRDGRDQNPVGAHDRRALRGLNQPAPRPDSPIAAPSAPDGSAFLLVDVRAVRRADELVARQSMPAGVVPDADEYAQVARAVPRIVPDDLEFAAEDEAP